MDTTVDIITTAVARSATARVASSLPTIVRQEATARVVTAATTLHPTAVVAALATDGAVREPPLPNRVRSATAVEAEAALVVTSRQALGRPYPTVRSHPTLLPHPEALRPAGHTVHRREAIVHRQGATLHQVVPTAHHREAIAHHQGAILHPVVPTAHRQEATVHHQEAILHPVVPTVRHPGAIVHHQGQVAIRGEHKVAAEVLEAVGDLTVGMIDYDSPTQIRGKGKSCVPKGQKPPAQGSRPGI